MKLISNELFKAVRYALYAGATAAVGLTAAPVLAQDEGGQTLETITVTGSRIRKADVETAQPIVVLDRATIEHQGYNSVADILQNLTEAGTPPISRSSVLSSGENVGGYYIDLRNLGASRTLVLLNGKRLGATTSGLQDLSQVPMAAIERIEVLKDGASAIYGSDAIAGVVNIITRRNFDGAEASAYVGQYDTDDGAKQTYSMTLGAHSDRGSVTMSAEYAKEDPTWARNRPYSAYPQGPYHPDRGWTIVSQYGNFYLPFCDQGLCALNPGGDPLNPNDWHDTNLSSASTADKSNANEQMMLNTGIERKSLFVSGEYSITDNLKFSTDLLYNKRSTVAQVAGYPGQFFGTSPGDPYMDPMSPYSYYNPIGFWHNPDFDPDNADDYAVMGYRRGWEVPRVTNSELQTYRVAGTLEGSFDIGDHTWNWDVGGYVNQNDSLKIARGDYSILAASQMLGPSFLDPVTGQVTCGTPDNPLPYGSAPGSCMPWNFLIPAGSTGNGALQGNEGLQALLFPTYHDTGKTRTVDYSANITGSVFTLPAGDLSIAAGYEYRNETGEFIPDAFSQSAQSTNLSSGPTNGRYTVDEYYLEVDVPILKDIPFARELSINVAGRYSDYSTFGDTTNGKFSLTWRPIDDLMVRGNYAQGFRAPSISDLYGGIGGTFEYYTDPCDVRNSVGNPEVAARCASGFGGQPGVPGGFQQIGQGGIVCSSFPCQSGVQFLSGSNPFLQPETSTSKTLGAVYSPSWLQGLDLSLDWYRIRIKSAIVGDDTDSQLSDCYVLGVESRCSSNLFRRDPVTGIVVYDLEGSKNAGYVDTEGYDFGVNYRLPEFSFGRFVARWNTTYVSKYEIKADDNPDTPVVGYPGRSSGSPASAMFRTRSVASLDWTLGDFGATWTTRYYSSIREKCSYDNTSAGGPECNMPGHWANGSVSNQHRAGANTFHDLQVRWNAPWSATVSAGANNVFGHKNPVMYSAPDSQFFYNGNFDIGRFYYVRYNQKF